jgi:hypothetical protein
LRLGAVQSLFINAGPHQGVYYRAVNVRYLQTALLTAHSRTQPSRYSEGASIFETLYLAEDHQTALFEVGALLGSPWSPGTIVSASGITYLTVPVQIVLRKVLDLTDAQVQNTLRTTTQEITGDWRGYTLRRLHQARPVGFLTTPTIAPTQELGAEAYRAGFDGILTVSAQVSYRRNIIVLPDNLTNTGGSYSYTDPATGQPITVL